MDFTVVCFSKWPKRAGCSSGAYVAQWHFIFIQNLNCIQENILSRYWQGTIVLELVVYCSQNFFYLVNLIR